MKKLPIGIADLSEIVKNNYIYIDKTRFVKELADNGRYYFLSRPRRFGKSLFVSTLKYAFLGEKEIFRGLYLEKNWHWSQKYTVIHIDFGKSVLKSKLELQNKINQYLDEICNEHQIKRIYDDVNGAFDYLLASLKKKYQQKTVVLIDEYDKPILDNIENREVAIDNRETLKNFYSVLKNNDVNLQFVFLTGVSKFSKVSLFSGLNNLDDLTLDSDYADICGYTQKELEETFAEYLQVNNVDLKELKYWYNGYDFDGTTGNLRELHLSQSKPIKQCNFFGQSQISNFFV